MPKAPGSLRTQREREGLPREAEQKLAKEEVQICVETEII